MKNILILAVLGISICSLASADFRREDADLEIGTNAILFTEKALDPSTPVDGEIALYAKDDGAGTTALYTKDSAAAVLKITSA